MAPNVYYLYLDSRPDPIFIGRIRFESYRGEEVASFSYDEDYLATPHPLLLDRSLYFEAGYQYHSSGIFPFIEDMMPDRWGKALMDRNESRLAKIDSRPARKLLDKDYLLMVDDESRHGALRIKLDPNGPFLADDPDNKIPPELFLNQLEETSRNFLAGKKIDDASFKDLLKQGSSLGGARPKASVYDKNKDLYIAKFPHIHDEYDVEAFEKLANDLAFLCGINVPSSRLVKLSKYGSSLLLKRFDREKETRIHFASGMSLLGAEDGDFSYGYLDLVETIREISASPKKDLEELFRRVAFNIAIRNNDDHLRNHGFLYANNKGFRLSPCYDLNPSLTGENLRMKISEESSLMSFSLLSSTCSNYGLSREKALEIIENIKIIVKENAYPLAKRLGIGKKDWDLVAPCFDFSNRE